MEDIANCPTKQVYDNKEICLREAEREEYGDMALVKYKYKNDYGAGVYRNDVISALFEPGSIMKPITVAIGLDTGEITTKSAYNDEGSVQIDQFTIRNVSRNCLGYHTFLNALNRSCNVGMVRIVQKLGKTIMYQYLQDFGIGKLTGIELQGEANSLLEDWEKWSQAGLYTRSYGL
ncbi:MAG: hypothetical protein LBF15_05760 [Candidatus Peribacteria bacterium]|nr:hypothetical protein [Candidatus Peribacteria bacterium]